MIGKRPKSKCDSTDHVAFFCSQCDAMCSVTKLQTEKVIVNTDPLKFDKCTWLHFSCPKHGDQGFRKFYHKADPVTRYNYK